MVVSVNVPSKELGLQPPQLCDSIGQGIGPVELTWVRRLQSTQPMKTHPPSHTPEGARTKEAAGSESVDGVAATAAAPAADVLAIVWNRLLAPNAPGKPAHSPAAPDPCAFNDGGGIGGAGKIDHWIV